MTDFPPLEHTVNGVTYDFAGMPRDEVVRLIARHHGVSFHIAEGGMAEAERRFGAEAAVAIHAHRIISSCTLDDACRKVAGRGWNDLAA